MNKRLFFLVLAALGSLSLMSCTTNDTAATPSNQTGSGVTGVRDVNGGPAAGAAASGPIGNPGH